MKWHDDDTIRFYRDTPDKRGVSELVINNVGGGSLHHRVGQYCQRPYPTIVYNKTIKKRDNENRRN